MEALQRKEIGFKRKQSVLLFFLFISKTFIDKIGRNIYNREVLIGNDVRY